MDNAIAVKSESSPLDGRGRSVRLISVDIQALVDLFRGTPPGQYLRFHSAIPPDGRVLGTSIDLDARAVNIAVESAEFPPVLPGAVLERVYVEVEKTTAVQVDMAALGASN
jgi:hypothetical protein